jgi:hypothetical protein
MTSHQPLRQLFGTVAMTTALALWALIELWSLARARRTLRGLHRRVR